MRRHNLAAVVRFEFLRTITARSFWITTLLVPVVVGLVFGLVAFSGASAGKSSAAQKAAGITFSYMDESGLITDQLGAASGGTRVTDRNAAIEAVKAGTSEAFFDIPKFPAREQVAVYGADHGFFENAKYRAAAAKLLATGVRDRMNSDDLVALAAGKIAYTETVYKDGHATGGALSVLPPLLFLGLFYLVILFLGNQILNSTAEEKENRVSEMVLTSVNPTTLIVGKVLSILATGAVQMAAFGIPVVAGYLLVRGRLGIPRVALSSLVPVPSTMLIGALVLIGGFLLFAATLVAVGAVMPSAKEASGIFSVMVILMFVPLYASPLIASDPDSPVVQVLTYFPFSAPVTGMLRNGLGSLTGWEAAAIIAELFLLGALMLAAAVKLFRLGSFQYGSRVSVLRALSGHARQ